MPELLRLDSETIVKYGLVVNDGELNRQLYEAQPRPQGVEIVKHTTFRDANGGSFTEVSRYDENGVPLALKERGIDVPLGKGQTNVSVIAPGTERFGHVHPEQDEYWYIASGVLSMALVDLRKDSPTFSSKYKVILPSSTGMFIPHGVVHGFGNYGLETVSLFYNTSHHFSAGSNTQEWRYTPQDETYWDFARPERV